MRKIDVSHLFFYCCVLIELSFRLFFIFFYWSNLHFPNPFWPTSKTLVLLMHSVSFLDPRKPKKRQMFRELLSTLVCRQDSSLPIIPSFSLPSFPLVSLHPFQAPFYPRHPMELPRLTGLFMSAPYSGVCVGYVLFWCMFVCRDITVCVPTSW